MAKRKATTITKAMRVKYAAPLSATVVGTAVAGIVGWAVTAATGVSIPDSVQGWSGALLAVGIWHYMPVEWEAK